MAPVSSIHLHMYLCTLTNKHDIKQSHFLVVYYQFEFKVIFLFNGCSTRYKQLGDNRRIRAFSKGNENDLVQ